MPNIYQNIDSNKRDSVLVMILFIAVVSLIGWFVGNYFYGDAGIYIAFIALIVSGFSGIFSFYNSDKIVLAISQAHEVSPEENPDLHNLVENMSIASGIPKPKVYVIEDSAMNAFATGRDPEHSSICFTTGIVRGLEKRELEGVVAHEMSHIGNRDTLLMCVVSVLVGTIVLLSDIFTRGVFYGGRRRRDSSDSSGLFFLVGFALLIISPIVATLIKLAISRKREYLADATAALITRYPQGLANALNKLKSDTQVLEVANGATSHLYIDDPVADRGSGFLAGFFNTHPPIEERIKRLENM